MRDKGKNNLLYFDDNEIITGKTENKKVFVTKRINGKETHAKQDKYKKEEMPRETTYKRVPNTQGFNFEREIVIGVNNNHSKNNKSFNKPTETKKEDMQNYKNKTKGGKHSKNRKKPKNERIQKTTKSEKVVNTKKSNNKVKKQKNVRTKRKNVDFYETFEVESNNKKKSKNKKFIFTILSFFSLTVAMIVMALITPAFNIQEIKVNGNDKVTVANIINLSKLKIGKNIFKNNKEKIKKYICENPYIEDVQVKRFLPGTIQLIVKERKPDYQVNLISSYIFIDNKGNILENSETKGNLIFIQGLTTTDEQLINGKKLNDTDIQKLGQINIIKEMLGEIEGLDLSEIKIDIKNNKDFVIYLRQENKKINIGDSSNLSNKMLYIKKILENEKGNSGTIFINGDLNEGFKPYFREEEYKE